MNKIAETLGWAVARVIYGTAGSVGWAVAMFIGKEFGKILLYAFVVFGLFGVLALSGSK